MTYFDLARRKSTYGLLLNGKGTRGVKTHYRGRNSGDYGSTECFVRPTPNMQPTTHDLAGVNFMRVLFSKLFGV